VQGPVVDVKFEQESDVPNLYEVIETKSFDGRKIVLEVAEHLENKVARCIALASTLNLQYNAVATPLGTSLKIPVGKEVFGRIINVIGEPIDRKGRIESKETSSIRKSISKIKLNPDT